MRLRNSRTFLTVLVIGLAVGVFCYLLSMTDGLRQALAVADDPRNLIVLAEPATAESNSVVSSEEFHRVKGLLEIAADEHGRPMVSAEVVVQTDVERRHPRSRATASVVIRGVDLEAALSIHPVVVLVEGRWFHPGANELVVGSTAARQFADMEIGATLECGDRPFTVVGKFRADGGAHESELWGHVSNVADAYRRGIFSSVFIRLRSADRDTVAAAEARIASSAIALRVMPESEYFAQLDANAGMLRRIALSLVVIMSIGALFAAMDAMYASVADRTREIAVLRAIGFSRSSVLLNLLMESSILALIAGVVGCLGCRLAIELGGQSADLAASATFTSVAFSLRLSAWNVVMSLGVALLIGILAGLWPAYRASSLPITVALREN